MESGVHSSLHPNCHHQITYAKFNLKIHYSPPYEREIWHYGKANFDHIRKAINEFPWETKYNIFSMQLSKKYCLITFLMKKLRVMIETHLG